MHSKIICLSGKAGSGKDTVATMIAEDLIAKGNTAHIISYAGVLKYICKEHLGWDGNKDEYGRGLLQYIGTDVIRAQNPMFFVDFAVQLITYLGELWDYVIIPDCRFENEVGALRMRGFRVTHGYVVREMLGSCTMTDAQKEHVSETEMDHVVPDFYINNFGTLGDLRITVRKFINENMEDLLWAEQ